MNTDRPEEALMALAQSFREALRQSVYVMRRLDSEEQLSAAQLGVLKMALDGGARVGAIARNLGVKVPSATEQIIKLERAGLVKREADPDDSRAVRVVATPAGHAAIENADRRRNEYIAGILGTLSEEERDSIAAALPVFDKINNSFQN
ncbi:MULTISPECIES: MarR family winged helix-turn-helix transcriptional regulator [Arthrobacter]|uniref:MarR family transcriptional regulator n=1 Tax=Arthrobacter terricola TaxID=2547396 RepID=A0A4R5K8H9_9MICC|nr:MULTISPECIES: MarR family transcriptional regulator [Arthrobacter]MBT8163397.1 MarR family transcriptional regulator [Arthrobacter sp. GN70]TDF90135.1 MarR family transcriptional regulator [Arthrobacter terricola]